eukprot:TRINITY_DN6504_c0_g1_i1.p1 TRINITY_DN6504_c0_g1~~TRINITY_DN6504_c0_g1_i1.p1  ORF type:complete len:394 (-),score=94.28 TRINITY_DN6504_c0_g1_i1:112-1203(-)
MGKDAVLTVGPQNGMLCGSRKAFFLQSLVSYFSPAYLSSTLRFLNCEALANARNLNANLRISENFQHTGHVASGEQLSPFPEIDKFVSEQIFDRENGIRGNIRSWMLFDTFTLVYNINRYRYCDRLGRHHKSNGIMVVVDLRRGAWHRKCHDKECSSFKPPEMPLPLSLSFSLAQLQQIAAKSGGTSVASLVSNAAQPHLPLPPPESVPEFGCAPPPEFETALFPDLAAALPASPRRGSASLGHSLPVASPPFSTPVRAAPVSRLVCTPNPKTLVGYSAPPPDDFGDDLDDILRCITLPAPRKPASGPDLLGNDTEERCSNSETSFQGLATQEVMDSQFFEIVDCLEAAATAIRDAQFDAVEL